jgi:hypothetical protein
MPGRDQAVAELALRRSRSSLIPPSGVEEATHAPACPRNGSTTPGSGFFAFRSE